MIQLALGLAELTALHGSPPAPGQAGRIRLVSAKPIPTPRGTAILRSTASCRVTGTPRCCIDIIPGQEPGAQAASE